MAASTSAMTKMLRGGRAFFSNPLPALDHQAQLRALAPLLKRAESASAPAAGVVPAAPRGDLLRGRTSSADLLPAIGRRAQQGGFGLLLPRASFSGVVPSAGTRLLSSESFKEKLMVVKDDTCILVDGTLKPVNSLEVLLDLQGKLYKVGYEAQLYRGPRAGLCLCLLVGGVASIGFSVWSVNSEQVQNKKDFEDLRLSADKTEKAVCELKMAIQERKKKNM